MASAINTICVKCGEEKEVIKRRGLICGSVDPQTGELDQEFGRHRFKPWTPDELEKMQQEEIEIVKQMGEMADFVNNEMNIPMPPESNNGT